jgi:hypothetical protein
MRKPLKKFAGNPKRNRGKMRALKAAPGHPFAEIVCAAVNNLGQTGAAKLFGVVTSSVANWLAEYGMECRKEVVVVDAKTGKPIQMDPEVERSIVAKLQAARAKESEQERTDEQDADAVQ